MSIENRPNLNAVGLLIDIQTAIERNIRGSATEANLADILVLVHKVFLPAIEEFDSQLDQRFPGQKESFTKEEFHHIWVEVHNGRGHHGSFLRKFRFSQQATLHIPPSPLYYRR